MSFVQTRFTLGEELADVWQQAAENHARYSQTGDDENDIRFFALALTGEAGELANFVKKRWRDGDKHETDIIAEIADVCAYAFMLAQKMGVGPLGLVREIARKQQVFLAKMAVRDASADRSPQGQDAQRLDAQHESAVVSKASETPNPHSDAHNLSLPNRGRGSL